MGLPTQPLPTAGLPNSTEDPKVRSCLSELQAILTAGVDASNLTASSIPGSKLTPTLAAQAGVNDSSTRVGKVSTVGVETYNTPSYGLMPTPDRVQSVVLPTDGLIFVAFQALWLSSFASATAAKAAIFIGANQLKIGQASVAPVVQEAVLDATVGAWSSPLTSAGTGLASRSPGAATHADEVTTGQIVGQGSGLGSGACVIFAAAGSYDISIQFLATSGTLSVSKRHLWVWTKAFA